MCIHIYICMYVYMYIYVYTHILCVHTHVYTCCTHVVVFSLLCALVNIVLCESDTRCAVLQPGIIFDREIKWVKRYITCISHARNKYGTHKSYTWPIVVLSMAAAVVVVLIAMVYEYTQHRPAAYTHVHACFIDLNSVHSGVEAMRTWRVMAAARAHIHRNVGKGKGGQLSLDSTAPKPFPWTCEQYIRSEHRNTCGRGPPPFAR